MTAFPLTCRHLQSSSSHCWPKCFARHLQLISYLHRCGKPPSLYLNCPQLYVLLPDLSRSYKSTDVKILAKAIVLRLEILPNIKAHVSKHYFLINGLGQIPFELLKIQWEREMGMSIPEESWDYIIKIHLCSICTRHVSFTSKWSTASTTRKGNWSKIQNAHWGQTEEKPEKETRLFQLEVDPPWVWGGGSQGHDLWKHSFLLCSPSVNNKCPSATARFFKLGLISPEQLLPFFCTRFLFSHFPVWLSHMALFPSQRYGFLVATVPWRPLLARLVHQEVSGPGSCCFLPVLTWRHCCHLPVSKENKLDLFFYLLHLVSSSYTWPTIPQNLWLVQV